MRHMLMAGLHAKSEDMEGVSENLVVG